MNHNLPSQANTISSPELSLERLNQLTAIAASIHKEVPEFMGMTAFGSVVRGEARPDSDVDICVFMELSASEQSPQSNPRILSKEKVELSDTHVTTHIFHPAIDIDYKALIIEKLPEDSIVEPDILVFPISKDIVDTCTDVLLDNARLFTESGDATKVEVPGNIRCLFNAPIDVGQLQPYIEQVLTGLEVSKYGEKAWAMIRHLVTGFEQGRGGSFRDKPHRFIPETLSEALAHFLPSTER